MSDEERRRMLVFQAERMRDERGAAWCLGHQTTRPARDPITGALRTECSACGLSWTEPMLMGFTLSRLGGAYCSRQPGVQGPWYYPQEHHPDLSHCICDQCAAASGERGQFEHAG